MDICAALAPDPLYPERRASGTPTSWRPGARRRCAGWRASGVSRCGAPAASWRRCIARPAGWPGWIWPACARAPTRWRSTCAATASPRPAPRARAGAAGGPAGAGQGAFRCAAAGRLGHAAGHGGRDEHGRGQDADRHAAGRHGGAGRAAGACHHHQRLSGRARRADHDAAVSGAGPERGLGQHGNGSGRAAAGLSGRHRVLLEQDPGLRLSARPDRAGRRQGRGPAAAGTAARGEGARRRAVPARPVLRHRGRADSVLVDEARTPLIIRACRKRTAAPSPPRPWNWRRACGRNIT